jgi:cytochrome bd ubiquinol oxidase subunit II
MDDMANWLPAVWAGLIATAVCMYVVLDGFDLGVGILFPICPEERDRDLIMNSVAPFWDGNETWLVLGGGGLLVAFPLAYAVIMPAVYLPVLIMLLALVFRGVSFEFRWVAKPRHRLWDIAFTGGSIVAAFCQGIVLGTLLEGVPVENRAFAGGSLDWLGPFPLFVGACMVAGYALLGATWLIFRVEGELAGRMRRLAPWMFLGVLAAMALVSLWTVFFQDRIFDRWFTLPNLFYLLPVPVVTAAVTWIGWTSLHRGREFVPFLMAIFLFLLGFFGLVISNIPYIVPPSITIWEAAASPSSQFIMLIGTVALLPMILGYTAFIYWTFRGKVKEGGGYH